MAVHCYLYSSLNDGNIFYDLTGDRDIFHDVADALVVDFAYLWRFFISSNPYWYLQPW